jgi:hypothetical protein
MSKLMKETKLFLLSLPIFLKEMMLTMWTST